jgi:glycosyltransferase involved in cell wall biosynthesis
VRAKTYVVPNGVDVSAFSATLSPATARSWLELAQAPTVVCLGRLCEQKGQDRLVEVWPWVRDRVPEAQLILVGDGPDREQYAGLEEQGIVPVGAQPNPGLWLSAADVVVVPSRWEGMALAPLEAMATGRSVVGFDVIGLAESVPPDAGALIAETDPMGFADAIVDRLIDPRLAAMEGARGRRHVLERHEDHEAAEALGFAYS